MKLEKAAETMFVRKTRAYKIDEIDTWSRFHQTFCVQSRRRKAFGKKPFIPCKALFTRDILTHNIAIKRYFWAMDV